MKRTVNSHKRKTKNGVCIVKSHSRKKLKIPKELREKLQKRKPIDWAEKLDPKKKTTKRSKRT